jgi:hypothetical protein
VFNNIYSQLSNKEKLSYSLLIVGVLLDHFTTLIGINSFNLIESNPIANSLIQNSSWLLIDFVLLIFILVLSIYLIHSNRKNFYWIYLYSLVGGMFRLYVSLLNLNLIFSNI